jgi:hypothetical protein
MYGIIEYDPDGKPICEICRKSFNRVISHVRQKHEMSERDYKIQFGFDLGKGICSLESSEKSRLKALENYDLVIGKNLIANGQKSRFKKGDQGRTRDQLSEQTRLVLTSRFSSPEFVEYRKELGRKVALSGAGNIARWNSNQSK